MKIKTLKHEKFITKSNSGVINGFLVPIYNIHDKFFDNDKKPEQAYLTVISKDSHKDRIYIRFEQVVLHA